MEKEKLEETLNRLYKENKLSIDAYSELIEFAYPNQALQLQHGGVISSDLRPEWLTDEIINIVKKSWNLKNINHSNPRTNAIKLIRQTAKDNGYDINLKKAVEIVNKHCL